MRLSHILKRVGLPALAIMQNFWFLFKFVIILNDGKVSMLRGIDCLFFYSYNNNEVIFQYWFLFSLVCAVLNPFLLLFKFGFNYSLGLLISFLGLLFLLVGQFSLINIILITNEYAEVHFQSAYWICFINFVMLCTINYIMLQYNHNKTKTIGDRQILNINIIHHEQKKQD